MDKLMLKIAASSLVLGLTTIGCTPTASTGRPATLASKAPKVEKDAAKLFDQAHLAVRENRLAEALALAERAVEFAPRDAGYRMLLGDLYLKNGRFRSAEQTFGDVLTLDPGNSRATLSAALAQIALGRNMAAIVKLDRLAESAAPGDIGLAYALAGQPQRAIALLEPAARQDGATARVRQNLAFAYALAGDWQKARVTASQDMSPADLDGRLQQWAALAQPAASHDQVAALLNVKPADDAGQPARLALAPQPEAPVALAAAEAPAPVANVSAAPIEAAPVEIAGLEAPAEPAPVLTYADAVHSLVAAQPAVLAAAPVMSDTPIRAFSAPKPRRASAPLVRTGPGRFAVQLGAFRTPEQVEKAWAQAHRRYAFAREPLSTVITIPGKGTFHRLAIAGFASHDEASRRCSAIRAKGGSCFVRATAGDAPVQWAGRYTRRA